MQGTAEQATKKSTIPFRQTLFWDVDPKTIDPEKNAVYVIERILDFGNDNEVRWMWNYYEHDLIRQVLAKSRVLSPQTRAFWNVLMQT